MKTSIVAFILAASLLQGCLYWHVASAAPASVDFDLWVATLNQEETPGLRNSPECVGVSDGFYPFAGQCIREYYGCYQGTQYNQTCPNSGEVFDPVEKVCTPYDKSTCKVVTTRKPFDCVGAPDGNYALSSGCTSSYYMCYAGDVYPQSCSPGVFDPTTKQCVGSSSYCTTLPGPTTTPTTRKPFDCTGAPDGNYAMGSDCNKSYYICLENKMYPQTCSGNGLFHPIRLTCVATCP